MTASVAKVCDPERYELNEAIQLAKNGAEAIPGFEIEIVRYLQSHSLSKRVPLATILRGLEVLGGMVGKGVLEENRLISMLRPFLRSSDPQIASKCVLVLGRRSSSMAWVSNIMAEPDARIRANLIEALWMRKGPDVEQVLVNALDDPNPRVVANATYGLHLLGSDKWLKSLERLLSSDNPAFRISGIWVLRVSCAPEASERAKQFIHDPNPCVRRAAFDALIALRHRANKGSTAAEAVAV